MLPSGREKVAISCGSRHVGRNKDSISCNVEDMFNLEGTDPSSF